MINHRLVEGKKEKKKKRRDWMERLRNLETTGSRFGWVGRWMDGWMDEWVAKPAAATGF